LWKAFGRFGRLGDVYIPNKVDKWGKRFAFVKFREDRDVMELCNKMEDVWIGNFKLRINKSWFDRKED
jgi:RNA recognition motif-containing protein